MNKFSTINLTGIENDSRVKNFSPESESKEYWACRFTLKNENIIFRKSKTTPKKIGQFVTFWKRDSDNKTIPFNTVDNFDYLLINLNTSSHKGFFVFPKTILLEKGIIRSEKFKGKNGFRVYPPWDTPNNKQALASQKWQLQFFKNQINKL